MSAEDYFNFAYTEDEADEYCGCAERSCPSCGVKLAMDNETVEFSNVKVIHETEKAILVKIENVEENVWIPKTQINEYSEVFEMGTEGKLIVTEWIAKQKGLI